MSGPRILLATQGSLGDLHPFIAVGLALQALGAEVTLASYPFYETKIKAAGLRFAGYGPSMEQLEADIGMPYQAMVKPMTADIRFMFRHLFAPYVESGLQQLRDLAEEADMVLGSSFAYGAQMAAYLTMVPFGAVALQPATLFSAYDPPYVKEAPFALSPKGLIGRSYNRALIGLGALKMRGVLRDITAAYARHGVPSQLSAFGSVMSDCLTLGLYSPLLGKIQPDFPRQTQLSGFPVFDSEDGRKIKLPGDLSKFLNTGSSPLVFSLGSAAVFQGEAYYRKAIEVSRNLKMRCVILCGPESPLIAQDFGPDVKITPYAPHSLLFPKARVVIHHGGIGSTAQALRSGRPILTTPVFADQFDNARRVQQLGAGLSLDARAFSVPRATARLKALLSSPAIAAKAADLAQSLAPEDGARRAAQIIIGNINSRPLL
jgi:rhamnosyltransferase subunit B